MKPFTRVMGQPPVEILRAEDQHVTRWSGGETRELCLAPEGTSYAGRDFTLRLSSATVEVEESTFTDLPDYNRILMPLHGTIRLQHDGGDIRTLAPFETDAFDGGAKTKSWGKCRDFNVMLAKTAKARAHVERVAFTQGTANIKNLGQESFFYVASGDVAVQLDDANAIELKAGELLHTKDDAASITFHSDTEGIALIHVQITSK